MDSQNAINKINEESDASVGKCLCPFGGDESNDCADCAYSGEYHFVDGECVARIDKHKS